MVACPNEIMRDLVRLSDRTTHDEEASRRLALAQCNALFEDLTAEERVEWSLQNLPGRHIVSSSFGAHAAVSLHLLSQQKSDISVVLIDTGYLFPETYRFVDQLTARLDLNLRVYGSEMSSAWQVARFGERWHMGADALEEYNQQVKVVPMKRAIEELGVGTWFAGLRRLQSTGRENTQFLEWSSGRWKVHPIADWSDRDVHRYLQRHNLPYHPLWEHGYLSIGDYHTTRSVHEVSGNEQLRFFGIKRECGLHEIDLAEI
jgi:phosphoadenosine phosphosulfate reductase